MEKRNKLCGCGHNRWRTIEKHKLWQCRKCGYKWLFDEDCREIIGPENLDYEVGKAEA